MGNCKNLNHAQHNEKVCNFLNQKAEFADWIITTAFYSSLHYVRHKVIPHTHTDKSGNTNTYPDFEELFNNFRNDGEGRHGFQKRWVDSSLSEIKFEYQRLYELSQNARYYNYNYQRDDAEKARGYLNTIKKVCLTKK